MTDKLHSSEVQQFGLKKEENRGVAELAPAKWYPTRGKAVFDFKPELIENPSVMGLQVKTAPIRTVDKGEGKVPIFFDPDTIGEFLYSCLGGVSSAEQSTVTISAANKFLDFDIGSTELVATIAETSYPIGLTQATAGSLCKAIYDAIHSTEGTGTYTVVYSRTAKKIVIARTAGTFNILWKTGTHGLDGTKTSIGGTIGYSNAGNDTGALTYTADTIIEYVFKHAFTVSGLQKQSYTMFLDRDLSVKAYNLCCVKKLALKGSVDGLVEIDSDIIFSAETSGDIGTPSYPTAKYLGCQNVDFKIATTSDTNVKDWDLNLDNSAISHRTLTQSRNIGDVVCGSFFKIEGGFTIYFVNETERAKFLANTAVALEIIGSGETITGSFKNKIDINIYEAHYTAYPFGEDSGLLAAKVTFEGNYSTSDSKAIQIDVTNQIVSY